MAAYFWGLLFLHSLFLVHPYFLFRFILEKEIIKKWLVCDTRYYINWVVVLFLKNPPPPDPPTPSQSLWFRLSCVCCAVCAVCLGMWSLLETTKDKTNQSKSCFWTLNKGLFFPLLLPPFNTGCGLSKCRKQEIFFIFLTN